MLPTKFYDNRHPLPISRIAPEPGLDAAPVRIRRAEKNRHILATNRPIGELKCKLAVHEIALGHNEQSRRVLVESMHDARPDRHIAGRDRRGGGHRQADILVVRRFIIIRLIEGNRRGADVVEQRAYKRSRAIAVGRMHHHPGWFFDYDHVFILDHDVEANVLRDGLDGWRPHHDGADDVAGHDLMRRTFYRLIVYKNAPLPDRHLHFITGDIRHEARQVNINALVFLIARRDDELDRCLNLVGLRTHEPLRRSRNSATTSATTAISSSV